MQSALPLLAASLALALPFAARADDPSAELRREISELRREVADLRRELYALRLDLLTAIDQLPGKRLPTAPATAPAAIAPTVPVAPAAPAPAAAEPEERAASSAARVTGTVELGGASAPAYVYVENAPRELAKGASLDIKQTGRQFSPRHAVVQLGTKLNFPNLDSTYHNVFSKTPGNTFDLGIYRAGDPIHSHTVTSPGVVDIYCDMHSEMSAEILVVPSRHHVAVGPDGRFTLDGVPRGGRKIVAWAPGFEPQTITVNVGAKDAPLSFKLSPKSGAHTNKNNQPYGSYK